MNLHYKHAGISLYHGDCADVLSKLDVKADLILTSPPYDHLRDYGGTGFDFGATADACVESLTEGGVLVWVIADSTIDGSETGSSFRQALAFKSRGLKLHDTMIYLKKGSNGLTYTNRHQNGFEYMFVFSNGNPKTINLIADKPAVLGGRKVAAPTHRNKDGTISTREGYMLPKFVTRNNVWEYDPGFNKAAPGFPAAHKHPAIFPQKLAEDHIKTWTNKGDLVLDPMCGSGTTLRAAKNLGRKAVGVEIFDEYLEIVTERMGQDVLI